MVLDDEGDELTVDRLDGGDAEDQSDAPSSRETVELMKLWSDRWIPLHGVDALDQVLPWARRTLDISFDRTFSWVEFEGKFQRETERLTRLRKLWKHHNMRGHDDAYARFFRAVRILYSSRALMRELARTTFVLSDNPDICGRYVPVQLRSGQLPVETIFCHDEAKLNSFQHLFLFLSDELRSKNFRRAKSEYHERVVTGYGMSTLAFKPVMSINDFVRQHTVHSTEFEAWRWATDNGRNLELVERYLTEQIITETPDLGENRDLRSFEGDEVGRGGGVYDCANDVFYPYLRRSEWDDLAKTANRIRKTFRWRTKYECRAPSGDDVCLKHFDAAFAYDVEHELFVLGKQALPVGLLWRNADAFECYGKGLPGDGMPRLEGEEGKALAALLAAKLPCMGEEEEETCACAGATWIDLCAPPPRSWRSLSAACAPRGHEEGVGALKQSLCEGHRFFEADPPDAFERFALDEFRKGEEGLLTMDGLTGAWEDMTVEQREAWADAGYDAIGRLLRDGGVSSHTYLEVEEGVFLAPLEQPARKRRARLMPQELLDALGGGERGRRAAEALHPHTYVCTEGVREGGDGASVDGGGSEEGGEETEVMRRYFRVDVGASWRECDTPHIDYLYECQLFTDHDKFALYAFKGRTLFKVKQYDRNELTLFFKGIAGCGKSTLVNAIEMFFPSHLIGMTGSNMSDKYGMSEMVGKAICVCREVSKEFKMPQEEWQVAVSGEGGEYNIKFKSPVRIDPWIASFIWAGNAGPENYDDRMGQVSRRTACFEMLRPVTRRDGAIMDKIRGNSGALLRRMTLSYFELVRLYGTIDVMSLPGCMPPAMYAAYRAAKARVDAFEDFLGDDAYILYNKRQTTWSLRLSEVKELYDAYRRDRALKALIKFDESVYSRAFAERELFVETEAVTDASGRRKEVKMVWCLRAAEPSMLLPDDAAGTYDDGRYA